MKVSELSGALLNYWVAKAEGMLRMVAHGTIEDKLGGCSPSTNWAQAGPIIERERINLTWLEPLEDWRAAWSAQIDILPRRIYNGDTPLIAAMRCYVASQFGDEVPDEVAE